MTTVATLDVTKAETMPSHEMWQLIYQWVYENGDPDEGANPGLDYLQKLNSRLCETGINISTKSLGWIHIEIYSGKFRNGHIRT